MMEERAEISKADTDLSGVETLLIRYGVGRTLCAVTVSRDDETVDGSHPSVTLQFDGGMTIVLRSMDDYEKVSWVTAKAILGEAEV